MCSVLPNISGHISRFSLGALGSPVAYKTDKQKWIQNELYTPNNSGYLTNYMSHYSPASAHDPAVATPIHYDNFSQTNIIYGGQC